jgi:hypothetical protein
MEKQEVFDIVVDHLRKQGQPSIGSQGSCAYRGDKGRRCAIGVLIPDSKYSSSLELASVTRIMNLDDEPWTPDEIFPEHFYEKTFKELLQDLQTVHDTDVSWDETSFREIGEQAHKKLADTLSRMGTRTPVSTLRTQIKSRLSPAARKLPETNEEVDMKTENDRRVGKRIRHK